MTVKRLRYFKLKFFFFALLGRSNGASESRTAHTLKQLESVSRRLSVSIVADALPPGGALIATLCPPQCPPRAGNNALAGTGDGDLQAQ